RTGQITGLLVYRFSPVDPAVNRILMLTRLANTDIAGVGQLPDQCVASLGYLLFLLLSLVSGGDNRRTSIGAFGHQAVLFLTCRRGPVLSGLGTLLAASPAVRRRGP